MIFSYVLFVRKQQRITALEKKAEEQEKQLIPETKEMNESNIKATNSF